MLDSLWVKSFRCLTENLISFKDNPFLSVISENNVGKTSLLEVCYILGNLNSFITSNLADVVPFEEEESVMGIKINNGERSNNYYLKIDNSGKKYITLNDRVTRSKNEIASMFRVNYISSDSLFLITSQPSFRRLKLDQSISQFSISYRKNMATYKRLLLQKNKLLKNNPDIALVKQINKMLAPTIIEILKERIAYLNGIEAFINHSLLSFTFPIKKISIHYHSKFINLKSVDDVTSFLNMNIQKEIMSMCSLYGPQRDDFLFFSDDRLIKSFYSRGVCRIIAYFFQLGQSQLVQKNTMLPMLLLLDEPFSEIHRHLKHDLIKYIPQSFYKIYTSTQYDEISSLKETQLYAIKDGRLCKH